MRTPAIIAMLLVAAVACGRAAAQGTDERRYEVRDDVRIRTHDGATLSATVIRPKGATQPLPTLLTLDIYTDPAGFAARGKDAADHGYNAVTADTRGKRLSSDPIEPYEHEAGDAYDVIDWIVHQPWSDGQVAMRGGSYSGFTAWAATKRLHPALKTIAVSAAAIPGQGLPMVNNIFLSANYGWAFYVGNTRLLDEKTYNDNARWSALPEKWFASGRRYRDIDAVDGTPNPWLQRWLRHPAYDGYWQAMVPYRQDYARIGIPVLTVTGYYDDGQVSALEYVREHHRYRPDAEDYVVMGPYDHFGTHRSDKTAVLRGYAIDPVAQFSTPALFYEWMDYVLRGAPKPAALLDRINYEVMGANEWHHAPTLEAMAKAPERLYFSATRVKHVKDWYLLTAAQPKASEIKQKIDLADHRVQRNNHYYPDPIIEKKLDGVTELQFASEPLPAPRIVSGAFTGTLEVTINKKDFDAGVTVFEQLPDGRLVHLAYWIGRASFAADRSARALLSPDRPAQIPFATSVVSRRLGQGSRLLVLLDVNMNSIAQVNYGTGKDVSDESRADAGRDLKVRWHTDSYVTVPFER